MKLPNHIEAVIFDFDGTLVDSARPHYLAWRDSLALFHKNLSEDEFAQLVGYSSKKIAELMIQKHDLKASAEQIAKTKDLHYLTKLESLSYIPKTQRLLSLYRDRYKLAIGTNEVESVFSVIAERFDLGKSFSVMVSLTPNLAPKPSPEIFLSCADRLGVVPSSCHVIEDSSHGIDAAVAAGMSYTHVDSI